MLRNALVIMLLIIFLAVTPFISFGEDYKAVCTDAAAFYGIPEGKYEVEFVSGMLVSADNGEEIGGDYHLDPTDETPHKIRIKRSLSRPMTIQTIFHEFAHAAQSEHRLGDPNLPAPFEGYKQEQHAELITFNVMWQSGYWWNAVHMLIMHSFHFKPSDYLVPLELWKTALTGARTVNLDAFDEYL